MSGALAAAAPGAGTHPGAVRRLLAAASSALSSRPAWALVAILAVSALAVGSVHPSQPSAAARITRLDSLIKCPSCVDLSIAQSDAPVAVGLRQQVALWVHEGLSDARIEQLVVDRFGEQALLVPPGAGSDVLLFAVPAGVLGVAGVSLAVYLFRRRRLGGSR